MRSLVVICVLCLSAAFASAQESKFMAGGGLTYATEIKNVGINVKGLYLFNDKWEADGGFTYFFKKDYTTWSALDFNGHYVLASAEGKTLYALAGLNMTFYKIDLDDAVGDALGSLGEELDGMMEEYGSEYNPYGDSYSSMGGFDDSGSEIGINIGIGGRMPISSKLNLTGELKYTLGGADYLSLAVGVMYAF